MRDAMVTTKDKIIVERQKFPRKSVTAIGRDLGISKAWVSKVLLDEHLPTQRLKEQKHCSTCGVQISAKNKRGVCAECYKKSIQVALTCIVCGTQFFRPRRVVNRKGASKQYFCNKECFGKWLGTHHRPRGKSKGVDSE